MDPSRPIDGSTERGRFLLFTMAQGRSADRDPAGQPDLLEALDAGVEGVGVGSQGGGGVGQGSGASGGLESAEALVAAEGGDG